MNNSDKVTSEGAFSIGFIIATIVMTGILGASTVAFSNKLRLINCPDNSFYENGPLNLDSLLIGSLITAVTLTSLACFLFKRWREQWVSTFSSINPNLRKTLILKCIAFACASLGLYLLYSQSVMGSHRQVCFTPAGIIDNARSPNNTVRYSWDDLSVLFVGCYYIDGKRGHWAYLYYGQMNDGINYDFAGMPNSRAKYGKSSYWEFVKAVHNKKFVFNTDKVPMKCNAPEIAMLRRRP